MNKEKQLDLLIWSVFVSIALLCLFVFLLPTNFQELLKFRFDIWNPITFITSTFVHADFSHLIGNIIAYFLVGSLVFVINHKSKKQKAFFHYLLLVIFILPLSYGALFLIINRLVLQLPFVSCGLSLVIGGLLGLIIPSLSFSSQCEPRLELNWSMFFLSSVCLTGSVAISPYLGSIVYNLAVFSILTIVGVLLLINELFKIVDFGRKGTKEKRAKAFTFLLVLSFYFVFLSFLFPENIVQTSGNIVNMFAHIFGVYFGLTIGYLVLRYEHRIIRIRQAISKSIVKAVENNHFKIVFTILVFWLIWSSLSFVNLEEYAFTIALPLTNNSSLFSAMAATVATILGIFFSISIIVIQHAASNYTPSILQGYKTDFRTWFVFCYYLAFLIFVIFSLQYPTNNYLATIAIITFILSFFFLASQFVHIITMIDPRYIIKKSKEQCFKDLNSVLNRLRLIIYEKKPRNKIEEELRKSPLYPHFIFHNYQDLLVRSKNCVLQISDVILKASHRQEMETCIVGLKALGEIVSAYVTIRKDDPTQEDEFLQNISVQLSAIFEITLENKDTPLMREIISTFEEIGCSTTRIKSISMFGGNHQTAMTVWNIHNLGKKAMEKDFVDVVARSISALKKVGIDAIQTSNSDGLASDKIVDLGLAGISKNDWFLTSHVFEGLKELLVAAISKRIDIYSEPSTIFEHIENLAHLSIEKGLKHWAFTSLFPILPENSIQRVAWAAFQIKNEEYPTIQTHSREEYCQEILSRLMETLGKIAIWTSKKVTQPPLWNTVDCMLRITAIMMREKFTTIKEGYKDTILKVVDDLSKSYSQASTYLLERTIHSAIPSKICDSVTTIAIYAVHAGKTEVTLHCMKALNNMCFSIIEKDKFGYDTARCAGRIGIIGAYSLHTGNDEIAHKAVEFLASFDKIYLVKSPQPHDELHIKTMKSIYKESKGDSHNPLLTETYGKMIKDVSSTSLDNFVKLYEEKRGL